MPLIDDDPPTVRPRGQNSLRLPSSVCGSVQKPQLCGLAFSGEISSAMPAGIWIIMLVSLPPASISSTRVAGSADSRLASTQPALPAPTMMKSQMSVRQCLPPVFSPS